MKWKWLILLFVVVIVGIPFLFAVAQEPLNRQSSLDTIADINSMNMHANWLSLIVQSVGFTGILFAIARQSHWIGKVDTRLEHVETACKLIHAIDKRVVTIEARTTPKGPNRGPW